MKELSVALTPGVLDAFKSSAHRGDSWPRTIGLRTAGRASENTARVHTASLRLEGVRELSFSVVSTTVGEDTRVADEDLKRHRARVTERDGEKVIEKPNG